MSWGFKYNKGSFVLSGNGGVVPIVGSEKVKKDFYHQLVVRKQPGGVGTSVPSLIGSKLSISSVDLNLKKFLKEATSNFVLLQQANPFLTDDETVDNASIDVWRDPEDVGTVNYQVSLVLKSGTIVDDIPGQSIQAGV